MNKDDAELIQALAIDAHISLFEAWVVCLFFPHILDIMRDRDRAWELYYGVLTHFRTKPPD